MDTQAWFVAASISGAACAVLAFAVIIAGWRRSLSEVCVVGTSLYVMSILMTSAALSGTTWTGADSASRLTAMIAAPAGLLVAVPALSRHPRFLSVLGRARLWTPATIVVASVAAIALSADHQSPPDVAVAASTAIGAVAAALLIRRQVYLYRVSRRRSGAFAIAGITALSASALIGPWATPGSAAAWVLLSFDNLGLLIAAFAMLAGYRTGRDVTDVMAPLVAHDPLAALDVGMAPEVHAFVAALGRKDRITRDHVTRTSSIALRAAAAAGLPAPVVRDVAIGAMLHDIGKLVIPSEIIGKPSKLTDEEFATIRTHPEQGERLLGATPSLAGAAKYVRWHHERHDGRGYPDGIDGDHIPFEVALVSAADAWDAMTHTRQYRTGMTAERAEQILRDGAGTQWHPDAVERILEVARSIEDPTARTSGHDDEVTALDCACDHLVDTAAA